MSLSKQEGPPPKKKRSYRENWSKDFDWLSYEAETGMKCSLCIKSRKKNAFVNGSTDYQYSSLTRHLASEAHQSAAQASKQAGNLQRGMQQMEKKSTDGIIPQLRTVMFLCQEGLALDKFQSTLSLQQSNGVTITGAYNHHKPVEEMLQALSADILAQFKTLLQESPFAALISDESVDVAIFKKLIIYVRFMEKGKVVVRFGALVDVPDGKADTITEFLLTFLRDHGITEAKLAGFGSDGAAVMMGIRNGVGVQLKRNGFTNVVHIHCTAHRLALAVSQSAREVPRIKKYEENVHQIFMYFHNSPVRYNRLREVQQLLIDTEVTLQEPSAVRWLSLDNAVQALKTSWGAIVTTLGEEAVNGNAIAKGLSQRSENFSFAALTCLLADIMPTFTKLSKALQSDALSFHKFSTMLAATRGTLESMLVDNNHLPSVQHLLSLPVNVNNEQIAKIMFQDISITKTPAYEQTFLNDKALFINELLQNLEKRFPADGMQLLSHFDATLNPTKIIILPIQEVGAYGVASLDAICQHFDNGPPTGLVPARARLDFLQYKHYVRASMATSPENLVEDLVQNFNDIYPDFSLLGQFYLTIPLNSVPAERGFSKQNIHKTKLRNRLGEERLEEILRVSMCPDNFAKFDYTEAAQKFRAMKERRK